jgi:hypothetical protein
MRHSFLDVLLPAGLLACVYALCFLIGCMASGSFESGAGPMVLWTLLASILCGAFCAWVGFMFADMEFGHTRTLTIGIGLLGAVITAIPSASFLINGHDIATYHREMAPKAQSYATSHFDDFDRDHSGMITDDELSTAASSLPTAEGRQFAQYVRDEQSIAGHVIGSYETTTYVWISTDGTGGGYMSPVTTTTYIYGITRGDLEGFTARTNERYKRW